MSSPTPPIPTPPSPKPFEPTFSSETTAIADYQLYLRKIEFLIGDASGKALDLSQFQVKFSVTSANGATFRQMDIRIYNLADDTAKRITSEFVQVSLSAGYQEGPFGLIFQGIVTAFRRGREDGTTTYLDVLASDGDISYNFGVVNTTLAAGWTYSQQLRVITDALILGRPGDVTLGTPPSNLPTTVFPRGATMYGSVKTVLRRFCQATGNRFYIQDGKLNFMGLLDVIPGDAIVLNQHSGMVGIPEQTIDGLSCRSLLNPLIVTGRAIHVDATTINQTSTLAPLHDSDVLPGVSANSLYQVYWVHHFGDNRGNDFYTDFVGVALAPVNGQGPSSEKFLGAFVDGQ